MRIRPLAAATVCMLALATGCQSLGNLAIQNPEYSIVSVRPRVGLALPLSQSTIDFDILMQVDNPNSVGLTLDRIDFDLLVDDRRVVQGFSNDGVRIPASGRGDVRLGARVGYSEIRNLWDEIVDAVRGDRPDYRVQGTAYYRTPVGDLKLPFNVRQRL